MHLVIETAPRKVSRRSSKTKATLLSRKTDTLTAAQPWACPTCRSVVSTPYCPACGERRQNENDLTLHSLFNQLFRASAASIAVSFAVFAIC